MGGREVSRNRERRKREMGSGIHEIVYVSHAKRITKDAEGHGEEEG